VSYFLADVIINRDDSRALDAVMRQTMECANVNAFMAKAGTPDAIHDLANVLDSAAKANVTVSTLDARGVDATGLMEASRRNVAPRNSKLAVTVIHIASIPPACLRCT
jgi:hypothetical protein